MTDRSSPHQLVEHFFRHESGRLVAVLVRFFGVRHFDLVEDMVQSALAEALRAWKLRGVPANPGGWVHRVAKNRILDALRRDDAFRRIAAEKLADASPSTQELNPLFEPEEIQDSLLRMIFLCCHPALEPDAAVPLTLKCVCGFGEAEIAAGLLIPGPTVRKRLYRAKRALMQRNAPVELPPAEELANRLDVVHNVLYLMFNEGYNSSASGEAIRLDVCEEAARLCCLLTEHPVCRTPATHALLSLMLFHASRFPARQDRDGAIVLLEEQDRSLWDRRLMARGADFFRQAAETSEVTAYHIEAAIAMHHCAAPSFEATNWDAIVHLYKRLMEARPNPVYRLNHAVAVAHRDGPRAGLQLLASLERDGVLREFHLLHAACGELHRLAGEPDAARARYLAALQLANSPHDQSLLRRKLAGLGE